MTTSPDRVVAGLVGERYEITGLIASGGMGTVYRARDTVLDRVVALKVLKSDGDDPSFVARFRAEATNAARLSHPNIVQVYDFGYAGEQPYMAMEYVDGQTLRDVLTVRGVLPPATAAQIAAQVASALEHARRAGIVHRDVKPENILVTTDGVVKVADFGLSRAFADAQATQAGMVMGTPHYLAPEQVQGGYADHRSDVYALGIVLYEMLVGRPPFTGDSPAAIVYKRVNEDVPSILAADMDLPRDLDEVIARATARVPEQRFDTAGRMAERLRTGLSRTDTGDLGSLVQHTTAIPVLTQETVAVERRGERTTKRARKRRRGLIFMLVLALLASAAFATTSRLIKDPVPTVVGLEQVEAEQILDRAGFDVRAVLRNHDTMEPGHVIAQAPTGIEKARPGSEVRIVVSIGPALFKVPDVKGRTATKAERALVGQGFKVMTVAVFHDSAKKNVVVAQNPEAGVRLEKGQTVTLTVSKGPELVTVPEVVGEHVDTAETNLRARGFDVAVRRERSDRPKDTVIQQSPAPGRKAVEGSTVTIVVSSGPPLVTVPDLYCMTRKQATDVLASKGFKVSFSGSGRRVVDQQPASKAKAPKGSTITAFTGPGTRC